MKALVHICNSLIQPCHKSSYDLMANFAYDLQIVIADFTDFLHASHGRRVTACV